MAIITNYYPTIENSKINKNKNGNIAKQNATFQGKSFDEILKEKSNANSINFSKHALERLNDRNIKLTDSQINRLNTGLNLAKEKGINNSLILMDDLAFIANTKNNTVITAVDKNSVKENVFTNINGAVII